MAKVAAKAKAVLEILVFNCANIRGPLDIQNDILMAQMLPRCLAGVIRNIGYLRSAGDGGMSKKNTVAYRDDQIDAVDSNRGKYDRNQKAGRAGLAE